MMKAVFVNGSPRKGWNTAQLLEAAMKGAADAGAETELIQLSEYPVTGCKSCFACKLVNSTTNGVCAVKDALRPVYERIMAADVLVIGAPVYFGNLSALSLAFIERLVFPVHQYKREENGIRPRTLPKAKRVALIADMNCPEEIMRKIGYTERIEGLGDILSELLSEEPCSVLYSCDTLQFGDYSKYDVPMFDAAVKKKQHDEVFPFDLQAAFDLGRALCGK